MSSVKKSVVKRKPKTRRLGVVQTMTHADYGDASLDAKVELIQQLIPLGLLFIEDLLQADVADLAGARYARTPGAGDIVRHGSNPGTVRLAGQRVPVRIPRVRGPEGEIPLAATAALAGRGEVDPQLMRRVLYGISCRNYEQAAEAIPGALGLSASSVSRAFVAASTAELQAFQARSLVGETYVALFLDGKSFADSMLVVALGITAAGEKRFLGFVEAGTENATVLTPFLRSLVDRGLDVTAGLLVILDGGKGLRSAVRKAFARQAVVQRCQWHKRENIVGYLPVSVQAAWRTRLQHAYERPTYAEARAALERLLRELDDLNQSAAASLREGLEETLTLHRLGLAALLGRSFRTTNCLESVNAQIEERCAKVDAWKNSGHKQRWLAAALRDIEPRLRRVKGYQHLGQLATALAREIVPVPQAAA